MLTLLPALLTIFGRRAFWPFVPHTPETAPRADAVSERARRRIVDGSGAGALARVVLACLLVLVLLPLVLLNWLLRMLSGRRIPSLIVGPLDRAVFTPYEMRRHRLEHASRRHPRLLGTDRRPGRRLAAPGHVRLDRRPADLLLRLRLLLDRPDQRRQLPHRSRIGRRPAPARQELPLGNDRADRHRRPGPRRRAGGARERWKESSGVEAVSRPGRRRPARHPDPGDPRTQPLLDRGLRPGRTDPRSGARRRRPAPSSAARPRSNSTSATPPAGTRS